MSVNTPYGRLTTGVQAGNYGISQAVDPTSTLRDPRQFVSRRQRAAAVQQAGGGVVGPLAGLSGMTDAVIASAKGPRLSQQGNQKDQQQGNQPGKLTLGDAANIAAEDMGGLAGSAASRVKNGAGNAAEWARQKMMQSTLSGLTDEAEANSVGSYRHGVMFGNGSVVTSTADTRGANGPLGSAGDPAGGIGTPPMFGGIGGF